MYALVKQFFAQQKFTYLTNEVSAYSILPLDMHQWVQMV